jgi:uncharacterized surface protein with fasciclin (FAS1) repeats/uncharacterized membrane protein YuzA (DUF378 family)
MKVLSKLAAILLIVGGLNWGLVAIAEFDLVAEIVGLEFGETNALSRVIYGLVGLAAVYAIGLLVTNRGRAVQPMTAALMVGVVTLALIGASSTASASSRAQGTIVETAVASGQFKTLAKLLTSAGLVGTLQKPGPYTVFAPTDAAFAKVPAKTLNALAKDKAKLKAVLLYHVVAGKVTASNVVKLSSAKTANGERVRIRVASSNVFVNNAKVTKPDVMAANGVIHIINRVLIPPA